MTARKEIDTLRTLYEHEHVVRFIEAFDLNDNVCIILEFCSEGDLKKFLTGRRVDDTLNLKFLMHAAEGVHFLHKSGVVHRDLKPENCLIQKYRAEDYSLKIGDFGISKHFNYGDGFIQTKCGTGLYMAPETHVGRYTEKCDVFSLGVLMIAVLERREDDKDMMPLYDKTSKIPDTIGMWLLREKHARRRLDKDVQVPDGVRDVVGQMLLLEYTARPTAFDVATTLKRYYAQGVRIAKIDIEKFKPCIGPFDIQWVVTTSTPASDPQAF
ncbi:serine/threonine-protein kinase pdik1l-B-like [Glandiceps talaboti]